MRNAIAFQIGNEKRAARDVWRVALRVFASAAPLGSLGFVLLWLHDRSQPAFLFVALAFPFAFYLQTVNVLYLVRHAIERINTQNAWTVGAGSSIATLVAVLVFHASVTTVLAIWVAGWVAAAVWAACGVPSLLSADPGETQGRQRLLRQQLSFAAKGGSSAIVTLLALRIDVLIVGATLPKASLGIYATALALAELMWTLSRSVTWATTGRIATEPRAEAIALTAKVVRLLLVAQTAVGLLILFGGPFAITLLYGRRFAGAGLLLQILLPRTIVYSADGVVSYFIAVRAGRPGAQFAFEVGTLALCAALTALAIRPFGLIGAACAATLSFIVAFAVKLAYFAHSTGLGWRDVLVLRPGDLPESARRRLRAAFNFGRRS